MSQAHHRKPYWGRPGNNIRYNRLPNIIIVHFHGPKLEMADCVMQQFKAHNVGRYEATWWIMDTQHEADMVSTCGCRSKYVPCNLLFNLLGHAYAVDQGEYMGMTKELVKELASRAAAKMKHSHRRHS